jgi:hypothetical protein
VTIFALKSVYLMISRKRTDGLFSWRHANSLLTGGGLHTYEQISRQLSQTHATPGGAKVEDKRSRPGCSYVESSAQLEKEFEAADPGPAGVRRRARRKEASEA